MNERLTKSDWLEHGLRTLAHEGAGALKVGAMAAALNVSRGSFYWHFADIADFRLQLLQSWRERATDQVIRELEAETAEPDRLKHLLARAFVGKRSLDRAIRSWAAEDPGAAGIVASAEAARVDYIAGLLVAAGVAPEKALPRAIFLYWAHLGQPNGLDPRHASIGADALDDIGDLFER